MLYIVMGGSIKRDIRPVLFKGFGAVLVLSLGGVLVSILRTRLCNKPKPPPSGGGESVVITRGHNGHITSYKHEDLRKGPNDSLVAAIHPSIRCISDNNRLLLPEFDQLVKDFDLATTLASFSPSKDADTPRDEYEREIGYLKSLVRVLSEREKTLEIQLLEFCGLKEQEAVVMELRNHLKINNMEAKIFTLKIEALQADNKRLKGQISDYAKVVTELEAAKGKIKLLKKKLKFESEQNKEHIRTLQQRVQLFQDAKSELQKDKNMEDRLGELKASNDRLRDENSELVQRLEYNRSHKNSVLEDQELRSLKKESSNLQEQNKDLTKQIDQLQAERCADVEELVYLRWINACLRHELRNYQPAPGKTTARDLSKTLSPKSEAKAKRLIMEYANREGSSENGNNSDVDRWSSAHSNTTDSVDFENSPTTDSFPRKTEIANNKAKFLRKLKSLVTGKDRPRRSFSMEIWSDPSTPRGKFENLPHTSSRSSIDLGKLRSSRSADMKDSGTFTRTSSKRASNVSSSSEENQQSEGHGNAKDSELMKYAKVLMDSSKSLKEELLRSYQRKIDKLKDLGHAKDSSR